MSTFDDNSLRREYSDDELITDLKEFIEREVDQINSEVTTTLQPHIYVIGITPDMDWREKRVRASLTIHDDGLPMDRNICAALFHALGKNFTEQMFKETTALPYVICVVADCRITTIPKEELEKFKTEDISDDPTKFQDALAFTMIDLSGRFISGATVYDVNDDGTIKIEHEAQIDYRVNRIEEDEVPDMVGQFGQFWIGAGEALKKIHAHIEDDDDDDDEDDEDED